MTRFSQRLAKSSTLSSTASSKPSASSSMSSPSTLSSAPVPGPSTPSSSTEFQSYNPLKAAHPRPDTPQPFDLSHLPSELHLHLLCRLLRFDHPSALENWITACTPARLVFHRYGRNLLIARRKNILEGIIDKCFSVRVAYHRGVMGWLDLTTERYKAWGALGESQFGSGWEVVDENDEASMRANRGLAGLEGTN
ncbi:hypothetical protein EDC01DRAFT_726135 [Geopyxis carbonaria]|nr:hypothetical protein EDC01DRAFT_726135 [Geopyxis carbonaria]